MGQTGSVEKCYASRMTTRELPYTDPSQLTDALRGEGYALEAPAIFDHQAIERSAGILRLFRLDLIQQ